ncbi:MAG: PIN domain-containing protein [Thermoguttaceae bacterium]
MIYADTGPLVARFLARDQFHEPARDAWRRLACSSERLLTSNLVLAETVNFLIPRAGPRFAADCGRRLLESPSLEILHAEREDEAQALLLMAKYADQAVSFTDCVSFVLMRKRRVRRALTFDQHFAAAGFQIWP